MLFYFAWAPDGNQPFSATYHREDEDVFSWGLDHAEGDFAALKVELKNPRVGMLRADRDQWIWFSVRLDNGTVKPLFHGRLVAVPEDLQAEIISVEFIGRPSDYLTQKIALANSMKVLPFYDPVWIPEDHDGDPDAVLEGYSKMWHIGRTDKLVTASDICVGEDTTYLVTDNDIFDESMSITYGDSPFTRIDVTAQVTWDQKAAGSVDISDRLRTTFAAAGSPSGKVASYTGQGLESDWPYKGDDIGGGWSVGATNLKLLSGDGVTPTYITCPIQETANSDVVAARFYLWVFGIDMKVDYAAERSRSETVTFSVSANMQDIDASAEPEPETLDYSSSRIVSKIDAGGLMPIGKLWSRTYFGLDRGKDSIEYLLCVCRSHFLKSARAAEITFEVPFEQFLDVSCRDNFIISSPRLPNGEAQGKVIGYSMGMTGDDGTTLCKITIGCTIGRGGALAPEDPVPTYSDGDYDGNYETYAGGSIQPIAGQIGYTRPVVTPDDDGVDFDQMTPEKCIIYLKVNNGPNVQAPVCAAGYTSIDEAITALNAVHTEVELNLVPVEGGPFELTIPVTTQPFVVPKTVDLEA